MELKSINDAYYKYLPGLVLKEITFMSPVIMLAMMVFWYSDFNIIHHPEVFFIRLPIFIVFSIFLVLRYSPLKRYGRLIMTLNALGGFSFIMMGILGLIVTISDPPVFRAAISGIIVDLFVSYFILKGRVNILLTYISTFIFAVLYFALVVQPAFAIVRELFNVIAIFISVFIMSWFTERSRFNEFFYKKHLELEKNKTDLLYHETVTQNEELQAQKEEILAINEQLEQRKEELQINLEVISDLNKRLRHQNKAITDSINYARRIQDAILPTDENIRKVLSDYFILFRPCNIVSGDFYWVHSSESCEVIAAVDCTGHGVPGGFMSMLGYSLLNEIVLNSIILSANDILNKLKARLKESLRQEHIVDQQIDGLDIALCLLNRATNTIQFSGAYMPLSVVRNNDLIHIKGDKMPIGRYVKEIPSFTNHEIAIHEGDSYYLYSDGYQDQLGGDENRRFLTGNFKKLLIDIYPLPFSEQKRILESTIDEWKGHNEQTDDIMVIGFRL